MNNQTLPEAQQIVGSGAILATPEKGTLIHADSFNHPGAYTSGDDTPTDEELHTLRRVAGHVPITAYGLCVVEFAERASFIGVKQVFSNFVNRPLPVGGNGAGAPPRGTQQTAGALGKGTVVAAAVTSSFGFLTYALPMLGGWLADAKWGRFKTIAVGIAICGVAQIDESLDVIMVVAAIPSVIQAGHAEGPFLLSLYILAFGAALFKPNISVVILDQNPHNRPVTQTLESGEKVVIDPEATTERMMLWFYLLINIGGFMGVPTSYLAKYVGFWSSFLVPGIIYFMLPALLWWLHPRLVLHKPGGSDLGNVIKVVGMCLKRNGFSKIGRTGFWEAAKPSVIAQSSNPVTVSWDDQFVRDTQRTFQACGIFLFLPIFFINDGGVGGAADALSVMLTTNGVPNDLIGNFNPLVIILGVPLFDYVLYPMLRKYKIHFGPIARMTTGMVICSIGSIGAINCFMSAIQYAVNLATAPAISDPHIVWAFAGPSIVGMVSAIAFWFIFKDLDTEEYVVRNDDDHNLAVNTPSAKISDEESYHGASSKALDIGDDSKMRHRMSIQEERNIRSARHLE
ncbi:putative Peptide transporter PTR2 [Glarea lozoyensis 74030]|uniref:Putative Peptide transporter PTR2 n=1 Tax=Glarea lozoyensis (strain ATCC 74030 / MF5533) TaxID=1104152 RepID=H0EUV4_GLAL7|nr:putative Peptide transporter PTR2 [Glarea lozoyensis 74030]